MLYPTIDSLKIGIVLGQLIHGAELDIESHTTWTGTGERVSLDGLDRAIEELGASVSIPAKEGKADAAQMEKLEGKLAVVVAQHLGALPIEILDDRGFWNYLAVSRFWSFISRREAAAIKNGNGINYVDARHRSEQIPLRLFLRAKAVMDSAPDLAWDLDRATDFWRSHVIRVQVGASPNLATAFARLQKQERMNTTELRSYARRLNRTVTNLVVDVLDEADAEALIDDLRE